MVDKAVLVRSWISPLPFFSLSFLSPSKPVHSTFVLGGRTRSLNRFLGQTSLPQSLPLLLLPQYIALGKMWIFAWLGYFQAIDYLLSDPFFIFTAYRRFLELCRSAFVGIMSIFMPAITKCPISGFAFESRSLSSLPGAQIHCFITDCVQEKF